MLNSIKRSMKYLHALAHQFFIPRYNPLIADKNILIICEGHIGDVVLSIDFMQQLIDRYKSKRGYSVYILCSDTIEKIFKEFSVFRDAEIIGDPYIDRPDSFSRYLKCIKRFKGMQFQTIIANYQTPITAAIIMNLTAKKKITIRYKKQSQNRIKKLVQYAAFTTLLTVPHDTMILERFKAIMLELGEKEYQSSIPLIQESGVHYELPSVDYIVVHLAKYAPERCWEPDKFAELINEIISRWGVHVVLAGGAVEEKVYRQIKDKLLYPELIVNKILQTGMGEWIELLRKSLLVIGVDSGCIHVAASTQTPSICIVGTYACGTFLPYRPNIVRSDDALPICVYPALNAACSGCEFTEVKSAECVKEVEKGNPIICLQAITVEQVMKKVNDFFESRAR